MEARRLQLRPAGGPTEPLRALAQDAAQQLAAGRRRDRVDELHTAGEVLVRYFVRGDVLGATMGTACARFVRGARGRGRGRSRAFVSGLGWVVSGRGEGGCELVRR